MEQQNKVPLQSLNPQQILQIKQQLENDVNQLNQSLSQFRFAYQKYEESKGAVQATEDSDPNSELLIPLSNSLYIHGQLDNVRDVALLIT